jgi:glycerol uptake facilitator-like aquaporin
LPATAVAIARSLSNTFSGIRPLDLPGFILAQIIGAALAVAVFGWLLSGSKSKHPQL